MEQKYTQLSLQIQKAKEGNQNAFSFLLDTFWNDVYSFQLKRTGNDYEAEDIAIRSFSKAFDKIETYNEAYKFKTWLITISKNIHIDLIRKRNSSIAAITTNNADQEVYKIVDDTPSPEDLLITAQNLNQLLRHIKKLKPHYQEVINLRYFRELSYKEMAAVLNEPTNNVKVKLLRARKLLSEIIQNSPSNP